MYCVKRIILLTWLKVSTTNRLIAHAEPSKARNLVNLYHTCSALSASKNRSSKMCHCHVSLTDPKAIDVRDIYMLIKCIPVFSLQLQTQLLWMANQIFSFIFI
uniref:Uncharacterized protein n=1 Tax=Setaria italica TaxID=4555 RepID=K3Z1R1_SETIT